MVFELDFLVNLLNLGHCLFRDRSVSAIVTIHSAIVDLIFSTFLVHFSLSERICLKYTNKHGPLKIFLVGHGIRH